MFPSQSSRLKAAAVVAHRPPRAVLAVPAHWVRALQHGRVGECLLQDSVDLLARPPLNHIFPELDGGGDIEVPRAAELEQLRLAAGGRRGGAQRSADRLCRLQEQGGGGQWW